VAAFIIGGAIITASYQSRARYALSAADNNIVWRMDTWSGQIDLCAATGTDKGPLVSCGALVVGNPLLRGERPDRAETPPEPEPAPDSQAL
jgi:hypothetical protein